MGKFGGCRLPDDECPSKQFLLIYRIVVLSIVIFIELITTLLILDLNKWTFTNNIIFYISSLNILAFVFDIAFKALYEQLRSSFTLLIFFLLPVIFFNFSVVLSLKMSYSVFHLLKHGRVFNFDKSNVGNIIATSAALIVLALSIGALIEYKKFLENIDEVTDDTIYTPYYDDDRSDGDGDHGGHDVAYVGYFELAQIIFTAFLILCNVVFFVLSYVKSTISSFSPSNPNQRLQHLIPVSRHQTAISTLVSRMKYYPIIQTTLFIIYMFVYYAHGGWIELFETLYILPSIGYLYLFLKFQPNALKQLKYRLGLGEEPTFRPESSPVENENTDSSAEQSQNTIGSEITDIFNPYRSTGSELNLKREFWQHPGNASFNIGKNDFKNINGMDDDEIASMIESFSSSNYFGDSDL